MMAEYAHYYGGLPAADSPWPLFRALCHRVARFEARAKLTLFDSVGLAIGGAFGGDRTALRVERAELIRRAYPVKDDESVFFENMFSPAAREAPSA